jgi:hypothetical protein
MVSGLFGNHILYYPNLLLKSTSWQNFVYTAYQRLAVSFQIIIKQEKNQHLKFHQPKKDDLEEK